MNNLQRLYNLGQSPWYDNIDRRLIEDGQLKSLFEQGVRGVTSNPTIFEKALHASSIYDANISQLQQQGKDLAQIYDELTAADVRDAADMLKKIYDDTKGLDGYVSIEVLPIYAHDVKKTIEYARHIFKKVDRQNIMIKIPATKESPEAITTLISDGINVNVTLIFSVQHYQASAYAYLEGLRQRARRGLELSRVNSVASVFISRIDSKLDNLLDAFALQENSIEKRQEIRFLRGKIAVANAKMIYQRFKEIRADINFADLEARGGHPQRPLWASTSAKNPQYSDCIYVDNLIGPLTVNTMPHQTVLAFLEQGITKVTLEEDLEGAHAYLSQLDTIGINLEKICEETQIEGLKAFERSFEEMMQTLGKKIG